METLLTAMVHSLNIKIITKKLTNRFQSFTQYLSHTRITGLVQKTHDLALHLAFHRGRQSIKFDLKLYQAI